MATSGYFRGIEGNTPPGVGPDVPFRSNVLLLCKLHKRTTKQELRWFCARFGTVRSINLWYGFGKGIVEMETEDEVLAIMDNHRDTPPMLHGKQVSLAYGTTATATQQAKEDVFNPMVVIKEVRRCVEDIVRLVEDKDNKRRSEKLRRDHNALLKEVQVDTERRGCRTDVCWEWVTRRSCWRGDECPFAHVMVPVSDLPARFRWFTRKDNYPNSRQTSPYKAGVNALLASLADTVANRRSLVLDGSSCNTVRSIMGGKHGRGPADVFVPNNCTETFLAIRDLGKCVAFHGSVRALLDSDPSRDFGFAYLDYCCSISAGRFHVEKSPVADIEQMFSNRQFDPKGCVLCVCLAIVDKSARKATAKGDGSSSSEEEEETNGGDEGEGGDYKISGFEECRNTGDAQRLRCVVTSQAAMAGMVAVCLPTSFRWPGNFAEVFYVASPAEAAGYLSAQGCPFAQWQ